MKFLVLGQLLRRLENAEYDILKNVSVNAYGRGSMKEMKDSTGPYFVVETDDYFRSFCAIAYGFEPCPIDNEEYRQLNYDGVSFLTKPRTAVIKAQLARMSEVAFPKR